MKNKRLHIIIRIWTNACRFILAFVFIFSGFVKAVDPLGTQYKIQDYLEAFDMSSFFPSFSPLLISILLAVTEFVIGVYFLLGIRRNVSSVIAFLMMLFMTPLTLYLALENPVSDCGCFGDALILTNWETFKKNLVLFIAALSVLVWRKRIVRLVSESSQWLIALYVVFYITGIVTYCLVYLPIFDFRPYRVGINILQSMSIPENAKKNVYESIFILEKEGIQKEFTLDNYPDSTWSFVDSRTVLKEKGYEPPIHDFSIVRINDSKDITEEILNERSYTFLLIAHRIEDADDGSIDLINEIYDYSVRNNYSFYCLTSSLETQIELWKDKTGAEYSFCQVDDIVLKTMIRSNPGLILIKNGTILNKWSYNNLPDEYILQDRLENLKVSPFTSRSVLYKLIKVFFLFAFPLLSIIVMDRWYMKRKSRKIKK